MNRLNLTAAILDTDGVITRTADVHARAWKQIFDAYLELRKGRDKEPHEAFDIESDYRRYVDGKPRYDGVASFLASRGIEIPFGDAHDAPDQETACGLGNRKNEVFQEVLRNEGVAAFDDTIEQIKNWRRAGFKVAVISSSRNCPAVLEAAGALDLFDARVDGNDLSPHGLQGKPAPDMFLRAAELLGVEPREAIVVEDAISGIEAGRRGNFGLVVGVARDHDGSDLREAGADLVVRDLREIQTASYCPPGEDCLRSPLPAMAHADWLAACVEGRKLALFLDYDGTLTPIVRRPEDATITDETRALLSELARHCTLAIVSGRDRRDAEQMVGVENLVYAGSHGFDIRGPGDLEMEQEDAQTALPDLDQAEQEIRELTSSIAGSRIERKKFAIAVHYREVTGDQAVRQVEKAVDDVLGNHSGLRKRGGKKIFELQPDVEWDKGHAVSWLIDALGLDRTNVVVIFIGDDVTDEDAFRMLRYRGIGVGIRVGLPTSDTQACYYLRDCDEVGDFLQSVLERLGKEQTPPR